MQRLGFIHDMMDVKVLILFVMSRVNYPVTIQQIYELCYQDECLSYFDVCTAVPEMVQSQHLKAVDNDCYEITEKGKADGSLTQDSIAFSVRQRAENAVARFNRQIRQRQAVRLGRLFEKKAEIIYNLTMTELLDEEDEADS